MEQQFDFSKLPDDIWLCIIKHIHTFTDLGSLSRVCRSLNRLVDDSYGRLKVLSFEHHKSRSLDLETMEPLFKKIPLVNQACFCNLKKINVIKRIGPDMHRIITDNCTNITSLNLTGVPIAHNELTSIVTKCDRITTLALYNTLLEDVVELTHVMDICRDRLLHLSMRNTSYYSFDSLYDVYIEPSGVYCLRSLVITVSLDETMDFVQSCPDLEYLSIKFKHDDLAAYASNEVPKIVSKCPKLKLINGIHPISAVLHSNIHIFTQVDDGGAIYDYRSSEEIEKIDQLMALFRYFRKSKKIECQQDRVPVTYGPVIFGPLDNWPQPTYYAKISLTCLNPSFIRNVLPGDYLDLYNYQRKLNLNGFVLSKADFRVGENYDESFIYLLLNNYDRPDGLPEKMTTALFSTKMETEYFHLMHLELKKALANRPDDSVQALRVLTDSFLCGILLESKDILPWLETRNILRSIELDYGDLWETINDRNHRNAISYALTHRVTLITEPDINVQSLAVVSLAHHLFKTRSHEDYKILVCTASDILAEKIHEMGKLRVAIYRPGDIDSQVRKPFYLDQRMQELPFEFPGIEKNVISKLEDLQLDDATSDAWREYYFRCLRQTMSGIQVLCCSLVSAMRLYRDHHKLKVDSMIIDNCGSINVSEFLKISRYLPRRIILVNGDNQLAIDDEKIHSIPQTSIFKKLLTVGFKPTYLSG